MIRADSRLLGALRKTVSTGGVARGIRVVMNETHLSVFYSVSKHARGKSSRNRVSAAARYAVNFFFISSKRLYNIHIT